MGKQKKYPLGDQSFESVRTGRYVYVDKSRYIEDLLYTSKYIFLSRPRRFGKSLFVSMLKCFFEGRRELFKGLYADKMEWDWVPRPVLYLALHNQQYQSDSDLDVLVDSFLAANESRLGITAAGGNPSARFADLIRATEEKTGQKVVILVDEDDKPLVNNIHHRERFEIYRTKLSALYSNFKSSADHIEMVFLTGVSRFGKLSVFSGLNNITDISFDRKYSAICGITEQELLDNFRDDIEEMAREEGHTFAEETGKLKHWYDGYHFSDRCPDIYNPYSLLNVLSSKRYGNYWISSGTPTLLVEQLRRSDAYIEKIVSARCTQSDLEGLDIENVRPVALFYQTGYLTIKSYDPDNDIYTLGLPNEEVKRCIDSWLAREEA